jgi:eukaryotic-like serine/threonine-protein kinase
MGFAHGKAGLKSPTPKMKTPAPGESGLSPQLIREQLQKIVVSRTFRQSKRLVRFLGFIVERALLEQGDQINEYLIGVEVYERPDSFDPQIDTIVRTEARRLRLKLQDYYDSEGSDDRVLIDVPKGAYAPRFVKKTAGISEKQVGQLISRYRLLEKLGKGGMGDVYLAEDTVLGRRVALKFISENLLRDNERSMRLFKEARAAALIDHPNVCTVHEIDEIDGHPFLVMAYVEGQNLEDRIGEGALELEDALNIACQLADGLQAAHQQGVVHRDLKPSNIITSCVDTGDARVRIIDFGLAQLSAGSSLTEPGTPIGTASYGSPEQMNGETADQRSDIWSLGVILYEMLTGERPFRGERREAVFYAIAHLAPEPMNSLRKGIPFELERIVSKCLEKDASRRYSNASSLRADLARLRGVAPASILTASDSASELPNVEITHPGPTQPAGLFKWNRRWLLGVAAAMVILVVASLFWFSAKQSHRDQTASVTLHVPRLAVLPFESRSPGEENQALSYAISDSLITRLARLSGLQVTSWTSALRLTERKATLSEIAQLLKVDYILEGSFLREARGFRVTVQCIRTADESHVWAEEFSASWQDIFAVQKQVSEGVVRQVIAQLNTRDRRVLASASPRDSRAYQAYAQGHYNLLKYDSLFQPSSLQDAEYRLKEAIQIDPDNSDALADLGRLCFMQLYPQRDDRMKMVAEGTTYLERTLALDPENVEAHCWLAGIYGFVGLTEKALELSREAVELGPNNQEAYRSLADRYRERGFLEASVAEYNRAILTDRGFFSGYQSKGWQLLELGDFDAALQTVKQMETVEPKSPFIGWIRGNIAFSRGDFSQAETEWRRILQLNPGSRTGIVEVALALLATRSGQLEEGKRVIDKFRDHPGFGSNHLIRLAAAVGDIDFAIRLVRTNQYYGNYRWLVSDPDMATLRDHAAFRELLNELYTKWQRGIAELGPSLPALPPKLPTPQAYLTQRPN